MATDLAPALPTTAGGGGGDEQRGLRSVFADSAVYGISIAALPGALLLATPLIARELDPAGFGTVDVLASIVAFLMLVALLGMDSAVGRSYFDYPPGDERRRGRLLPGYLADLVVLSRDPLECPPDELDTVEVVATMVGGRWVHNPPPWE